MESKRDKESIFRAPGDELELPGVDEGSAKAADSALAAELAKARAEKEEVLQTLVQRQADFENYKKRMERDRHEEARRGLAQFITDVIPVLDAFDRAIQGHDDPKFEEYVAGVKLIRKQLWDALARHGVERIDASGKIFDPHVHQALDRTESKEYPDGMILSVFQDGYIFHGRVLRPAIVRVAVHPGGDEPMDAQKTSA